VSDELLNLLRKNSQYRRRWPLTAALLAMTAFVVPIVYGASPAKRESPKPDNEFASLGIVKLGRSEPAQDFVLNDTQGNAVRLSALRGRLVFVNFWATWCPPCRQEMPSMDRLYRTFKDSGFAMLAIDVKESKKEVADFMKKFGLSFPALLDTDGSVSRRYRIVGLPATYLIDRTGQLIGHKPGGKNWATPEVIVFFQRLLGHKGAPELLMDVDVGTLNSPVLPSLLHVKLSDVPVYGQQDRSSQAVARVSRGDKLFPLGKATAEGESWYMVKTEQGLIGWVRRDDVEEHSDAKHP